MLSLCIIIEERKYKKKKVKPQVCRSMWLCLIPHSCWKLSSGDSEADLKLILAPQREVVLLEFDFFFFKCVTYIRRIKVCLCKCDGSSVVLLKYSAIVYKHSCWAAVALDHLLAAFSIHGRQPVVSFRWRLCCYPTVPQKREHEIVWRKDLHQASPLILTNIAVISLEKKNKSLYNNTINWLDMILHWIQKVWNDADSDVLFFPLLCHGNRNLSLKEHKFNHTTNLIFSKSAAGWVMLSTPINR